MKSFFAFAALLSFLMVPLSAQELLLNYKFDESSSGTEPTADLGEAEPKVPGRFFVGATRTGNTPGGASRGALDLTNGGYILSNFSHEEIPSLDGKLDNLDQATVTVWFNLQEFPEQYDRIFATGRKGIGLQIIDPITIDEVDPGPLSAANFSLAADVPGGSVPTYVNFDADDKWIFVAYVIDPQDYENNFKFYYGSENEETVLVKEINGQIFGATEALDNHLVVGNYPSKFHRQLNGYVDDLRIYNGALTPEQIEEVRLENLMEEEPPPVNPLLVHYNFDEAESGDAEAADLSEIEPFVEGRFREGATRTTNTPGNFSTAALDVTADKAWLIANQNDFDGKLDHLSTFTTTVWVNLQKDPSNLDRIFRAGGTAAGFGYRIIEPSSGSLSASNFGLALEAGSSHYPAGIDLDADNKWVFLAFTFSGKNADQTVQFISGDASNSAQIAGSIANVTLANTGALDNILALGGHPAASNRFIGGYLDDFRVYGGVLSLAEIETIRRENLGSLPPSGRFDDWVADHFDENEQTDPSISGPEADPDGDGIANLLEYALGGNPKIASREILPNVDLDPDSGYLTLTFVRPADIDAIDYIVESSTTFEDWNADAVLVESTSVSGGIRETYRAPTPINEANRSFLRLRIVQN